MATVDLATRDRLLADHLRLVRRLCRRYSHSGEPMEHLVQVGTIGLLKAIEKFDPQRGNDLIAYAMPVIVGEIKNYFRDHGWGGKRTKEAPATKDGSRARCRRPSPDPRSRAHRPGDRGDDRILSGRGV